MSITLEAIHAEIEKIQQPLLERIVELEKKQDNADDYIWKLNELVYVLMQAFPPEQAQLAIDRLDEVLADASEEQQQNPRYIDLSAARLRLQLLQEHHAKT